MKSNKRHAFLIVLVALSCSAIASEHREHKVLSQDRGASSAYISLGCVDHNVKFSIQWNTPIGTVGKYKRHLVLPGDLGDTHILLKVLSDKTSTGIIDNDKQAKSLIKLILQHIKTEYMSIEVFPEDRDSVTGQWESSKFNYKEFLETVDTVAKECKWDITKPIEASVRTVNPGAPYDDE